MAVSSTASVAITRVRRVRELHVVVIFDLAFWSANPPGLRHGRVTTRARRNVLGAVASETRGKFFSLFYKRFDSSKFFPYFCPHVSSICFALCSGLRICLKRCQAGWGCCVLHHTTFLEFWDNLGRIGTACDGLEGLGRLRKITSSRTV